MHRIDPALLTLLWLVLLVSAGSAKAVADPLMPGRDVSHPAHPTRLAGFEDTEVPIALLPAQGVAEERQRKVIDKAIRSALIAEDSLAVQPAATTRGHIKSTAELGLSCGPSDVMCLQKLGIVAEVEQVLVPELDEAGADGRLPVRLLLVDVGSGELIRAVEGSWAPRDEQALRALVGRVLYGDPEVQTPALPPTPEAMTSSSSDLAPPRAPSTLATQGFAAAAVGGGIAVIGFAGAVTCEALFWSGTGSANTRRDVVAPLGAVFWVTSATGLLASGVGGLLWYVGGVPAED